MEARAFFCLGQRKEDLSETRQRIKPSKIRTIIISTQVKQWKAVSRFSAGLAVANSHWHIQMPLWGMHLNLVIFSWYQQQGMCSKDTWHLLRQLFSQPNLYLLVQGNRPLSHSGGCKDTHITLALSSERISDKSRFTGHRRVPGPQCCVWAIDDINHSEGTVQLPTPLGIAGF